MKINKEEIISAIYRIVYTVKWYFISLGYAIIGRTGNQLEKLLETMDEMFIRNIELENEIAALESDLNKVKKSKTKTTSPKKRKK